MLSMLKDYKGPIEINGEKYDSINSAISRFNSDCETITIKLSHNSESVNKTQYQAIPHTLKKIYVKQYMTRKSTPGFTFMKDKNNDVPMPFREMIGTVEMETPRMVFMRLHADITQEKTIRCMCCGRPLTNPVSQYFGIGPECGGHNYVNPFYNEEELKKAVAGYRKVLQSTTWEGWVIKSAILEETDL